VRAAAISHEVASKLPPGPVRLAILDMQGSVIRRYDLSVDMSRVLWDGSTESGARARPGSYVCTAAAAGVTRRARLRLVRG